MVIIRGGVKAFHGHVALYVTRKIEGNKGEASELGGIMATKTTDHEKAKSMKLKL